MPEHVILRGITADSTYHDGIHVAEQNFVIQYDYDGFPSDIIYEYAASYTGSPLLKINIIPSHNAVCRFASVSKDPMVRA